MGRHFSRWLGLATVLASMGLATACGGATVTSEEAAASKTTTSAATSTTKTSSERPDRAAADAVDRPAEEIEEIPEDLGQPEYSKEDQEYLDALAAGGIEVAGVEQQLLGVAQTVCADSGASPLSKATPGAAGGQLVSQGLTELSAGDATKLIEENANKILCDR